MKKSFLAGAFLCLLASHASAQSKGSYLKFGAGYQFAVARQSAQFNNFEFSAGGVLLQSSTRYSLQSGIAPMVSFGHMFTEHLGFEIGVNYLFGKSSEIHQELQDLESAQNHLMKVHSNNLMITPSLRFAAPLSKKVSIYSRTGLVIPILARTTKSLKSAYAGMGMKYDVEINSVVKNRFALGFAGALGLGCQVSEKVSLNIEVAGQMLNLWADREKINSFRVDNVERKPEQFGYSEETIYVRELDVNGRRGYALTYQSPFHSLGVNLGVAFHL